MDHWHSSYLLVSDVYNQHQQGSSANFLFIRSSNRPDRKRLRDCSALSLSTLLHTHQSLLANITVLHTERCRLSLHCIVLWLYSTAYYYCIWAYWKWEFNWFNIFEWQKLWVSVKFYGKQMKNLSKCLTEMLFNIPSIFLELNVSYISYYVNTGHYCCIFTSLVYIYSVYKCIHPKERWFLR